MLLGRASWDVWRELRARNGGEFGALVQTMGLITLSSSSLSKEVERGTQKCDVLILVCCVPHVGHKQSVSLLCPTWEEREVGQNAYFWLCMCYAVQSHSEFTLTELGVAAFWGRNGMGIRLCRRYLGWEWILAAAAAAAFFALGLGLTGPLGLT